MNLRSDDQKKKMHEIIIRICDDPIYEYPCHICAMREKKIEWGIKTET